MFENYKLADLLANIYKHKVRNSILFLALLIIGLIPFVFNILNSKVEVSESSNFSSYLIYKIDYPNQNASKSHAGYSDFYADLLESNLNGAFLFNDIEEPVLNQIAKELDVETVTLKNSTIDFWDKKIIIKRFSDSAGVSVKILTASETANQMIEQKLDHLINLYKSAYENVNVEKLDTVYSTSLVSKIDESKKMSMKKIVIQVGTTFILVCLIVVLVNFVQYAFNPTINYKNDFERLGMSFIYDGQNINELKDVLVYKFKDLNDIALISTNQKIYQKFANQIEIVMPELLSEQSVIDKLLQKKYILFVEEYGVTHYKEFELLLQKTTDLNKTVLGVITKPL